MQTFYFLNVSWKAEKIIIYCCTFLFRFYKGLPPLWMRQIPYTMMKFACFERTVEALYKYVVPKPRSDCSKPEQLVVTFAAGYIAGVFCAVVSHPADTVVSKLNNDVGSTPIQAAKELGMKGTFTGFFSLYFRFISIALIKRVRINICPNVVTRKEILYCFFLFSCLFEGESNRLMTIAFGFQCQLHVDIIIYIVILVWCFVGKIMCKIIYLIFSHRYVLQLKKFYIHHIHSETIILPFLIKLMVHQ